MADYAIAWDGESVTFPPAGPTNPDGVPWARIHDHEGNGIYGLRWLEFSDAAFAARGKKKGSIAVPVVLIPRPDNPFDSDAVSIALPKLAGGDAEARCLGYLYSHTLTNWGIANGRRRDLIARLADLSADGEVHCTGILLRENNPAKLKKYRCDDDEEGWDIPYRIPRFRLDLPKARIMGAAIRDFLDRYEDDPGEKAPAVDLRAVHREWANSPAPVVRWIHELRTELIQRLVGETVTHTNSRHHTELRVRREGVGVKVVNEHGACIGKVKQSPKLVMVGNEFDRPAVIEALSREGLDFPFDPTPGWLNAELEPHGGVWIHVVWLGRIAGINVEPILASFDDDTKELHVFAAELAEPIETLLRRVGHVPQEVRVRPHPRDPEELFGQDLVARLMSPKPLKRLRPEARELIPADWAEQIEARWRWRRDMLNRNAGADLTGISPQNQRPPEDPQIPSGLFQWALAKDAPSSDDGCRLCGGERSAYFALEPYCGSCIEDARYGLFLDRGFTGEPWHQVVIESLVKLAVVEFGDAPAQDQLRSLPREGPDRDLLVLCRMLTARGGHAVPGGDRKVYAWTDWLAEAGLLSSGVRTSRGVVAVAKDGHLCRSLLERQIDDFLSDNGIPHDIEPFYPYDADLNPHGYRADWKLADGTFVEALGFTKNPVYMAKAERKLMLGSRYGIPIVTVTDADRWNLLDVFAEWLPPESQPPTPIQPPLGALAIGLRSAAAAPPRAAARNPTNSEVRAARVERCRVAVELQVGGSTRKEISEQLGVSPDVVPSLLRDGKFFANPASDQLRFALAEKAATARERGLTRAQFRDEARLSNAKAAESWRDADVVGIASLEDLALPQRDDSVLPTEQPTQ